MFKGKKRKENPEKPLITFNLRTGSWEGREGKSYEIEVDLLGSGSSLIGRVGHLFVVRVLFTIFFLVSGVEELSSINHLSVDHLDL